MPRSACGRMSFVIALACAAVAALVDLQNFAGHAGCLLGVFERVDGLALAAQVEPPGKVRQQVLDGFDAQEAQTCGRSLADGRWQGSGRGALRSDRPERSETEGLA